MKETLKVVSGGIAAIVVILALVWVFQGNDFFMAKVFNPKYEQVRRDTFVQSQAYNEGMAKEVENYHLQYVTATPDQQKALASVILQQVSGYDTSKLPPADQLFINQLRSQQGLAQ